MTGIILTGGKSSRMGRNKAFLRLNGEVIIERTVRLFNDLFDEVILVTNSPDEYKYLNTRIVSDMYPQGGSLIGIYSGLYHSSSQYSFVAACDMPFLKKGFIEYIIKQKDNYDIVIPFSKDGQEPLHAVYSRTCLKPMEGQIKRGNLKIIDIIPGLKARRIERDEIIPFDPEFTSFINVNTPSELERAEKMARKGS
ncbi:MAG: molybdenum cofactor guanylyltransferase [Nitrospirae bacterium]|nr:molybdenum cofactor guanylyltransferase [Nitrospirota bacterium]